MPIKSLNPYLIFDGTATQAIALYEPALGAKVEGPIMADTFWGTFGMLKDAYGIHWMFNCQKKQ